MTDWPAPGWVVHETVPALQIHIDRDMPPLPASIEAEIDALWAQALVRTEGRLFNGRVFCADTITPARIGGHWTEYRRIVAQMDRPDLFDALHVRPCAVNGIVIGPDGVVFGRRPPRAVYQADLWQCPPAGSIDIGAARENGVIDYRGQVLAELAEELGVPPAAVRLGDPLALVEHAESHVCDLGVSVEIELAGEEIRALHANAPDKEYASVEFIPPGSLPGFFRIHEGKIVPQAHVFLTRLGLLPSQTPGTLSGIS